MHTDHGKRGENYFWLKKDTSRWEFLVWWHHDSHASGRALGTWLLIGLQAPSMWGKGRCLVPAIPITLPTLKKMPIFRRSVWACVQWRLHTWSSRLAETGWQDLHAVAPKQDVKFRDTIGVTLHVNRVFVMNCLSIEGRKLGTWNLGIWCVSDSRVVAQYKCHLSDSIFLSLVGSVISRYLHLSLNYVVMCWQDCRVCLAVVSVSMYTCPPGFHDEYWIDRIVKA